MEAAKILQKNVQGISELLHKVNITRYDALIDVAALFTQHD